MRALRSAAIALASVRGLKAPEGMSPRCGAVIASKLQFERGRIASTTSAILAGSVTGSEQVWPTQINAALTPAAILACAGWPAGKAPADGARKMTRLR